MTNNVDLSARFERLYVPAVTDVMSDLGLGVRVLPPGLQPVHRAQRAAGPAFPYRFIFDSDQDRDTTIGGVLAVYESAPPGSILVAAAGVQPPYAAHFGELSAITCQVGEVRGAIIDGGLRDGMLVADSGFPVWFRYRTPVDVVGHYAVSDVGQPVTLGEVTIRPGDFVMGDLDGVVIVPAERVVEVLEAAEACASDEAIIRRRLHARERATTLFNEIGRF